MIHIRTWPRHHLDTTYDQFFDRPTDKLTPIYPPKLRLRGYNKCSWWLLAYICAVSLVFQIRNYKLVVFYCHNKTLHFYFYHQFHIAVNPENDRFTASQTDLESQAVADEGIDQRMSFCYVFTFKLHVNNFPSSISSISHVKEIFRNMEITFILLIVCSFSCFPFAVRFFFIFDFLYL